MTAVLTRARAELRARLKPMLALTLLVGLGAAAVMTLAAGARRTDTAYPRFARAYKAADMLVYPSFGSETFAQLDFKKVAALPQVAAGSIQHFLFAGGQEYAITVDEPPYGVDIDRFKVLEGRRPQGPNEIMVPYWTAKEQHWHIGTTFTVKISGFDHSVTPYTFTIVGIEAAPGEFPPQISGNTPGGANGVTIHITTAAYEQLKAKKAFTIDFLLLRFKRGAAENQPFNDLLNSMAVNPQTGEHIAQLNDNLNQQAAEVQRAIHLQAIALWLVAGLIALIVVLILSQLLARQATIDSTESPTLLALGMSRTQVWLTGMARAFIIGLGGAAIGVAVAYALSGLMPLGVAHIAEPTPGLSFDVRLLVVAAVIVVGMVLALAAWPIWKNSRIQRKAARLATKPSLAARTASLSGVSPTLSTGVRLALESGNGATEVPVRSSLLSVVLAIVALTGALTFGAGLNHLLNTPRLYGWGWDVHLTTGSDNVDNAAALSVLVPDPRVQDVINLDTPPLMINGKDRFDVIGGGAAKGTMTPVLVDGRAPELPTEVALGAKTMRDVHVKIGDSVRLHVTAIEGSPDQSYKVVGKAVLPPQSPTTHLGSGAIMTEDAIKRMVPKGFTVPAPSDLYMTFAPGVDKKAALADIMNKTVIVNADDGTKKSEKMSDAYDVLFPSKPTDLVNFGSVQNLPLLLAGLVGLLAAATLAHILVTAIRRRRRDLAILKMIGFVPSQVRFTVAPWQATTFVLAALVIGIPVGIIVGRAVWSALANQLGAYPEAVTPAGSLLLTLAGTVLLANLIAITPAYIAGRMRPAPALRAE